METIDQRLARTRLSVCMHYVLVVLGSLGCCYLSGVAAQMSGDARANSCGGSPFVEGHSHTAFLRDTSSSEVSDEEEDSQNGHGLWTCKRPQDSPSNLPVLATNEATSTRQGPKPTIATTMNRGAMVESVAEAKKKGGVRKKYKGSKKQRKKNKKKKMGKKKKRG
ncbi:hypothetical protein ElyMa_000949400 [Elysia marginata]|uniref:Transmembrane protein n=1 Tax=Elysia marginata TaxID=1093978 RepID=A0AAV4HBT1_9GAST|nr:hypothetical protein ElyMa_000949400 [Elysia marginata]